MESIVFIEYVHIWLFARVLSLHETIKGYNNLPLEFRTMYELILKDKGNRINTNPHRYAMVLDKMLQIYKNAKDQIDDYLFFERMDVCSDGVEKNELNENSYLVFCNELKQVHNLINDVSSKSLIGIANKDDDGITFVFSDSE